RRPCTARPVAGAGPVTVPLHGAAGPQPSRRDGCGRGGPDQTAGRLLQQSAPWSLPGQATLGRPGQEPAWRRRPVRGRSLMATPKRDAVLAAAEELAREAAVGIAEPDTVGAHVGFVMDQDRVGTHY